jgi:hypothetical protein
MDCVSRGARWLLWFFVEGGLANEGRLRATGAKGVEYPKRFFARDYANNRLEFSL